MMAGAKPKKAAAATPAGAGPKSAANTTRTVYLDAAWKSEKCKNDRDSVEAACKDKPEQQKKDEKTRNGGLVRLVRNVTGELNELGQTYYGYSKGKPAGNEWMDDHCSGMWIKPLPQGLDERKLDDYKKNLDRFGDTIDSYLQHPDKIVKAGFEQVARQAIDKFGYDNVIGMLAKKFGTDAFLAALPVKAGAVAKVAAVGKVGFSAAGYANGAQQLATALATDHAKEILQGMEYMLGEKKDRLVALQKVWKERPDIVMAELMSINGEFDACLKARKCHFVPYRNNTKANAKKGAGCCPGQTAHHVIPDSAVRDAKCKDYTHDGGLTICLEGQDNTFGSHGRAHGRLDVLIANFNGPKKPPKPIPYPVMRDKALEAVKENTNHCEEECLKAQLDEYYVGCEDLIAKSGKGGAIPKDDDDVLPAR